MKSINIIITLAIVGFISTAPGAALITNITAPSKLTIGSKEITLVFATTGWTDGDQVILAASESVTTSTDPTQTVTTAPTSSPLISTFTINAAGTYYVYVKEY